MKKFLISFLVIINIFILISLLGLVFYEFKQILDRNNQIDNLNAQLVQIKINKKIPSVAQSTAVTQTSLQIKDEAQSAIFDSLVKSADGKVTVKINFLKKTENTPILVGVNRNTDRTDILNFVTEELIKGPTSAEQNQSIYSPLGLSGTSNCGSGDFKLSVLVDRITIQFCKSLVVTDSSNILALKESIEFTFKQLTGTQKAVILNNNSTCFGDTTGQNSCNGK